MWGGGGQKSVTSIKSVTRVFLKLHTFFHFTVTFFTVDIFLNQKETILLINSLVKQTSKLCNDDQSWKDDTRVG